MSAPRPGKSIRVILGVSLALVVVLGALFLWNWSSTEETGKAAGRWSHRLPFQVTIPSSALMITREAPAASAFRYMAPREARQLEPVDPAPLTLPGSSPGGAHPSGFRADIELPKRRTPAPKPAEHGLWEQRRVGSSPASK